MLFKIKKEPLITPWVAQSVFPIILAWPLTLTNLTLLENLRKKWMFMIELAQEFSSWNKELPYV